MTSPHFNITDQKAIAEAVKKNGGRPLQVQIYFLTGIFGELENCNGVAEDVIDSAEKMEKYDLDPTQGGTYVKLVGCSYLYKGDPKQNQVFGMEQAKSMISDIPRDILGGSFLYAGAALLRFIFQRKKFINDLHKYFQSIKDKTIRHCSPAYMRLAIFTREIRRAMDQALRKEFNLGPEVEPFDILVDASTRYTGLDFAGLIAKAVAFFTLIMELDAAYRFPTQDALGEVDKENAKRSGAREMLRIVQLMIDRNTNLTPVEGVSDRTEGVPHKFRFMKRILQLVYLLSPQARRITQYFLLELDIQKVALDPADWYFCLRRNTHNYRGIPLPERLAELKRIDAERGHQYIKIEWIQSPEQAPRPSIVLQPPQT